MIVCDPERTAALLDFPAVLDALAAAALELDSGALGSPPRQALALGSDGVLLSMPATAADIGIHKLVTVQPANTRRRLPTIHGALTVCDAVSGRLLCLLDGPEVTGRRTAALSMLAIRTLLGHAPREVLLIGTGSQAACHVRALHALHPGCRLLVRGRGDYASRAFCMQARELHPDTTPADADAGVPDAVDVVIAVTTSSSVVYDLPARASRLVVGVGAFRPDMAEIGATTLRDSAVYVDDPAGARHEAGDLLRAGVDWARVTSLASLLRAGHDAARPAVFKSVGSAAWDLAAARVALRNLELQA